MLTCSLVQFGMDLLPPVHSLETVLLAYHVFQVVVVHVPVALTQRTSNDKVRTGDCVDVPHDLALYLPT